MNEPRRPHPLDADDDDDLTASASYEPAGESLAYKPLLKPSLMVAAVATVVLFLSSVISVVAALGSSFQTFSLAMFRISGLVLVLSLLAVLVAYRIQFVRSPRYRPRRKFSRFFRGFGGFVLANLLVSGLFWLSLFFFGSIFGPSVAIVTAPLLMIAAGLLATMTVVHRGYLRAFAIASLTTLILQLYPLASIIPVLLFGGGFPRGGNAPGAFNMFVLSSGGILTIAQLSGLISAAYVVALETWTDGEQNMNKTPSSDSFHEK